MATMVGMLWTRPPVILIARGQVTDEVDLWHSERR